MFSTKRLSVSLDDIRRKMIAKRVGRNLNRVDTTLTSSNESLTKQSQMIEYKLLPENDMSFASEKQCRELDIYNEELFKKQLKLYAEIQQKIAGSNLELKKAPQPPPNPNNLHRLLNYRQRNKETNCLRQTVAVFYLLHNGYSLITSQRDNITFDALLSTPDNELKVFEPFQAIELATELADKNNECYMDVGQSIFNMVNDSFINVLKNKKLNTIETSNDSPRVINSLPSAPPPEFNPAYSINHYSGLVNSNKNIYPSLHKYIDGMIDNGETDADEDNNYLPELRRSTAPARLFKSSMNMSMNNNHLDIKQSIDKDNRIYKCENPEHHSVNDKIGFYEK